MRRGLRIAGEIFVWIVGVLLMLPIAFAIVRVLGRAIADFHSSW
jgi:hypothetical protein